ncbi:MAG: helix-turn-helix transcriptional regulator [Clostridia bacterium]|nr:helix-turn-helix transcriptional regulator [Clostridia bacterium]
MSKRELKTDDLLKELISGRLDKKMLDEASLPPFPEYLNNLCRELEMKREHVIRRSGITRTYGHQIFNGTRRPARDKVIQLAFGFGLDLEKTQELLRAARKSMLYPRIKRDAVILYSIEHGLGLNETGELLAEFGMEALCTQAE